MSDRKGQKNITLVGGMNGRGKTTLLDSVFLCLYGRKAVEYITGKKISYSKALQDRINKSAEDKNTYIKLSMEMDDGEGIIICITRSWCQNSKKIDTRLIIEKNGLEDSYLSENWEYYVEELVPFGIAKFFFFDNEKISQIADDEAFDKIKDSIQYVMGVTTIESLCSHIERIRKDKTSSIKKSETATLSKEADEIAAAIEAKDSRKRNLYAQKAALVPELEKTNDLLEQTEQEFWKRGGNLGFNRDSIAREQQALKEQDIALKAEALIIASNPATPLCLCPMFDRGKLKIFVRGIKNNEHGILWTKGGVILIDDETVTLKYLGTLAVFDRKTVNYYRETDGTVIFGKVLRIYDDKQDFLAAMFPIAFDKFMKAMKDDK